MIIGYTVGISTPEVAYVITKAKVRLGNYMILEYDNQKVLGLITSVNRGSTLINDTVTDIEIIERIREMNVSDSIKEYIRAKVKLLCKLIDDRCENVDLPPPAGTIVRLAEKEELEAIFSNGPLRLGKLIGTEVSVNINPNYLNRHLAIIAATGSGKSNTVAILSQRLAEQGGCVLIFDYHGEYYDSDIKFLNPIEPKLNPLYLTSREFATLLEIRENAFKQYRVFRRNFEKVKLEFQKIIKDGIISNYEELTTKFFEKLIKSIEEDKGSKSKDKDVKYEVINKIEEFADKFNYIISLIAPDIISYLKLGSVNVINITHLDEEAMDAIISHYLRRILDARKEYRRKGIGLRYPVLVVIEEAHVFLSRDRNTLTKYWASRISREGRKFGVGLVIVSQRPKGLDENILSQMTNKIILKIIEPTDKKYILEASDNLSEDLVEQLSTLDVGEAIVIGKIVKIPAIVKIDKFPGSLQGSDPDLLKEWKEAKNNEILEQEVWKWGEELR